MRVVICNECRRRQAPDASPSRSAVLLHTYRIIGVRSSSEGRGGSSISLKSAMRSSYLDLAPRNSPGRVRGVVVRLVGERGESEAASDE